MSAQPFDVEAITARAVRAATELAVELPSNPSSRELIRVIAMAFVEGSLDGIALASSFLNSSTQEITAATERLS